MDNADELYIYIDESGTMNFRKNERYFIVCALVVSEFQGKGVGRVVKDMIHEKSKTHTIQELHGSQMSVEDKVAFFSHMKSQEYNLRYLVLDKYSISKDIFKNTNACFNYIIYLLISDLIVDNIVVTLYITVDNRNIKTGSEGSLQEYLYIELIKRGFYNRNIHVKYADSIKNKNLQAVDLFVNAMYIKYNHNKDILYNLFSEKIYNIIFFHKLDSMN